MSILKRTLLTPKVCILLIIPSLLAACGGGGGSNKDNPALASGNTLSAVSIDSSRVSGNSGDVPKSSSVTNVATSSLLSNSISLGGISSVTFGPGQVPSTSSSASTGVTFGPGPAPTTSSSASTGVTFGPGPAPTTSSSASTGVTFGPGPAPTTSSTASAGVTFGPGPALATPSVEVPDSVIFSRSVSGATITERVQSHYSWGWQMLPRHQNPAAGSGYVHLVGGSRPAGGVSTQWLTFNIKSSGLFTNAREAHIAVLGRHEGAISRYNRGRGFTIGGTENCDASQGYASTQGEIWFDPTTHDSKGNNLMNDCMPNALKDHATYKVVLHIADSGYAYTITDVEPTSNTYSQVVVNKYVPVANDGTLDYSLHISSLGGYAIALAFADKGTWSVTFSGIESGWF